MAIPSLALIPTGFKDGKLYSVLPESGVGDFDVVRGSGATRVNKDGLVVDVRNLSGELVTNGDFSNGSTDWDLGTGWSVLDGKAVADGTTNNAISQTTISSAVGKTYKIDFTIADYVTGNIRIYFGGVFTPFVSDNGNYSFQVEATAVDALATSASGLFNGSIDNISVKEMLVNRESTATNTGIVERSLTGVNESDLWLDSESTSVVNNTGIVERPITGVNESDPMFPDNTISNIVNIAGLISSLLADLEARATTFENREATQNILINLQKC